MESILQFLKEAKVATEITDSFEHNGDKMIVSVTNYDGALKMKDKYFAASVVVRYIDTDKIFHHALYQQTIGVVEANKAIEKIMKDPAKYQDK